LAEEGREPLVDLYLKGVTLNLAEVRIDGRVERHRRRDAVLHAGAEVASRSDLRPLSADFAALIRRHRRAWNHFQETRLLQLREDRRHVRLEHPLAWPHLGPRP